MIRLWWFSVIAFILMTRSTVAQKHPFQYESKPNKQPNIVMIMADDLGWNDLSMHGSNQFLTPNIDALGWNGITLQRHYSLPLCTPSRAALMTGRHGYHTGMFNYVIVPPEPWGMPLTEKILPEVLRDAGYKTHLIGKWHLGFFKREYTPIYRGFDTFNGYLDGAIDYWDHTFQWIDPYARGYDMRNGLSIDRSTNGTYATDLFTNQAVKLIERHDKSKPIFLMLSHLAPHTGNDDDPLQAPQSEIDKFNYIQSKNRRILAAMISKLDYSVGQVVKSLKKRNMLDNTVILFISDNGAPTIGLRANYGSNYPLKGKKDSPWEGASRVSAAIFSPLLKARQRVSNQFIHITDWFKTFAELAGVDTDKVKPNLDGYNMWDALSYDLPSPRDETVINIDSVFNYAAFIKGSYKYVEGTRLDGVYDDWLGLTPFNNTIEKVNVNYANAIRNSEVGKALSSYVHLQKKNNVCWHSGRKRSGLSDSTIYHLRKQAAITCAQPPTDPKYKCEPLVAPCLFDIFTDPCETKNLASTLPGKLNEMRNRLAVLRSTAVPALNKPSDPNSNPALHDFTWTYWRDV